MRFLPASGSVASASQWRRCSLPGFNVASALLVRRCLAGAARQALRDPCVSLMSRRPRICHRMLASLHLLRHRPPLRRARRLHAWPAHLLPRQQRPHRSGCYSRFVARRCAAWHGRTGRSSRRRRPSEAQGEGRSCACAHYVECCCGLFRWCSPGCAQWATRPPKDADQCPMHCTSYERSQ